MTAAAMLCSVAHDTSKGLITITLDDIGTGGGQDSPVHCSLRQTAKHCDRGEAKLVEEDSNRQTNGDCQPNLHTKEGHAEHGSIEHQPVNLADLQWVIR